MPIPLMWSADFDYVRLTWHQAGFDEVYHDVYQPTVTRAVAEAQDGEVSTEPWAWLGYHGISSGMVQAGAGPSGAILQASGWAAAVVRELQVPWTGCPRCDIQVTVWYDEDPGLLPGVFASRSSDWAKLAGARAWRVAHINGYGNGDTAYFGARTSDKFIRIYDKGRESPEGGHYTNALRYEVELKNEQAAQVWAGENVIAPGRDWVAAQVRRYLRDKGIYLALPDKLASPEMWPRQKRATTTDTRLAWLAGQVRPSIDKLLQDGVKLEHIRELLGLT